MNVTFDTWRASGTPAMELIRTVITIAAELLNVESSDITIDVVTLEQHFLSDDGTASLEHFEGAGLVAGAVFFPGDVDTKTSKHYTLGLEPGCDFPEMMLMICHEMVHVAQYVDGRLRTLKRHEKTTNWWKGEIVSSADVDYENLPWEIEAYELQDAILSVVASDERFMAAVNALP